MFTYEAVAVASEPDGGRGSAGAGPTVQGHDSTRCTRLHDPVAVDGRLQLGGQGAGGIARYRDRAVWDDVQSTHRDVVDRASSPVLSPISIFMRPRGMLVVDTSRSGSWWIGAYQPGWTIVIRPSSRRAFVIIDDGRVDAGHGHDLLLAGRLAVIADHLDGGQGRRLLLGSAAMSFMLVLQI